MATIFEKIRDGLIPSVKIYDDDLCFVILDLSPVNKGHALVIAKECAPTMTDVNNETLHHMIDVAKLVDKKMREVLKADGTNVIINNGPASGQEVFTLFHAILTTTKHLLFLRKINMTRAKWPNMENY